MIYHVSFPGLGLDLTLDRVAFTLFGLPIYWYGILIATGMMLALLFAFRYARSFGIDADRMVDVILISTVFSVMGGRVFYVAMAPFKYESFAQMLDIRQGGLAIYGAVIGAFAAAFFVCKWRKVPVLPMFDLASMGFLIGQGIGRWGNFVNQEAFGTNTTLPWGMYSDGTYAYLASVRARLAEQGVTVDPTLPVHPTFLYESIWCILGFFVLWAYMKHRKFHGEIILLYIIWYGAERFFVEGLRTDSLMLGSFRVSQLIAAVSVLAALALWLVLRKKYQDKPLMIEYTVLEKRDGKMQTYVCTWPLTQTPPTDGEIKEKIERLRETAAKEPADGPTVYRIAFGGGEQKAAEKEAEGELEGTQEAAAESEAEKAPEEKTAESEAGPEAADAVAEETTAEAERTPEKAQPAETEQALEKTQPAEKTPEPETEPATGVEIGPETRPAIEGENDPETKPAAEGEAGPETEPATEVEAGPETKPAVKGETGIKTKQEADDGTAD